MKRILLLLMLTLTLIWAGPAMALPVMQLDISNSVYDTTTETVVATSDTFTLYALIDPNLNGSIFYISAAVSPQIGEAMDLGSFSFDGTPVMVTGDMTYGTPPIELVAQNEDLPGHSVYPTYFTEFSFEIDPADTVAAYNVQDTPGGFGSSSSNDELSFAAFDIDVSNLADNFAIHFDLYTKNPDGSIAQFAPFSHDAQSASSPVPEPASLLLLGTGLLGIAGISRKKLSKK